MTGTGLASGEDERRVAKPQALSGAASGPVMEPAPASAEAAAQPEAAEPREPHEEVVEKSPRERYLRFKVRRGAWFSGGARRGEWRSPRRGASAV